MHLIKDQLVKHPTQPQWGVGVVIEDSRHDIVEIFFTELNETKRLSLSRVQLEPIEDASFRHRNLIVRNRNKNIKSLIDYFLEVFPAGFDDIKYIENERLDKELITRLAAEWLSQDVMHDALQNKNFEYIAKSAQKLISRDKMHLISTFEAIKFNDALKHQLHQQNFAYGLYDLLYGNESDFQDNFMKFSEVLSEMDAQKWPIMTFFLFVFYPHKHIFVKPSITQDIAKVCDFNIQYKPEVNYLTYKKILMLAESIKTHLINAFLPPKDMIDVQSFMWSVEKY
ncbi:DUF3553 domain-containing protein [Wohlfahrtiimonas chitiniclastica]|uniref:DUF3553 domain-containing protein n=1 Tax=Wohlfahrtiimonas chitiniclastica TaxID=400946 RepID=UPI001BCB0603|nr:DUF3553 domain-containing protein [Wohlfahrtiimonas chitiniclastica]MBS7818785.1 DUF3553 domain-containing protein [Wohlfahrtiimonas chitiniclastica]MBS7825564.1 DUF3553 domain-containing protein [Wohlfahrtiimonas chitiniclastica]